MKLFVTMLCLLMASLFVQAQERYILTSDSVKLYVNVKGKGPACLYLHGGPGSGSYWLEQFAGDMLEQHFQMIYLDQRGVGRSSSPKDNNYSMDRMVKDFEEVRESLGFKRWLTLGHSFGGVLQMGYVMSKPDVVSGMICINCSLSMEESIRKGWLPKAIELAGNDTPEKSLDQSAPAVDRVLAIMPVLQKKGVMWKIFYASEENDRKMSDTYKQIPNWNNDFSEKAMTIPDYLQDFRKFAPNIKQPVLFFYGKSDWAIGPEHYKGVSFPEMMLYGSEVGHMPFMENKEDLAKAIRLFAEKYRSFF